MSKYISLENLERYDAKMQERAASFCASKEDGMWRQTDKAGAVSFWPVGNSPLEGTVEFMFKETGPASGDKSPTNPSAISGVSSVKVTRAGKNLIWEPWSDAETVTKVGITWTVNGDGTVTANGRATSDSYFNIRPNRERYKQKIRSGVSYVLSGCPSGGSNSTFLISLVCKSATFKDFGSSVAVSVGADDSGWLVCCVRAGVTVSNLTFKPQLELGSTATAFEPYEGTDYTVNLGNTYYGGSFNLATGLMTVTHHCYTVTGNTDYSSGVGLQETTTNYILGFYPDKERVKNPQSIGETIISNKFPWSGAAATSARLIIGLFSVNIQISLPKSTLGLGDGASYETVKTAFKTYFASNPADIIYPLVNPYTVQLTPPQILSLPQPDKYVPRLNTVYTDADAVQIVYQKNPVRDKFEKVQAIIAQGGNV